MTPEQIALDALDRLGEQPGTDPIGQLRAIANDATLTVAQTKPPALDRPGHLDDDPDTLAAALGYESILDRATTAITAVGRIDQTERTLAPFLHAADLFEADPTGDVTP